jgi:excisionase family DNA binding protein
MRRASEQSLSFDDLRTRATITIAEAARLLNVSVDLAYESARRGELPCVSLGRRRLVVVSRLLEQLGLAPTTEASRREDARADG